MVLLKKLFVVLLALALAQTDTDVQLGTESETQSESRRNLGVKLGQPLGTVCAELVCPTGCQQVTLDRGMCQCWCNDPNEVINDVEGVGEYGGTCVCPNGERYQVGAYENDCNRLACFNGEAHSCSASAGIWSHRKVICKPEPWKINKPNTNDCVNTLNEDECKYAKMIINKHFHGLTAGFHYDLPKGCMLDVGSNTVLHNHHRVGQPNGSIMQLCKDDVSCHVELGTGPIDKKHYKAIIQPMAEDGGVYPIYSYRQDNHVPGSIQEARIKGNKCQVTFTDAHGNKLCRIKSGDYSSKAFANACKRHDTITHMHVERSECTLLPTGKRWANLDFGGHVRTVEVSKEACRDRCERTTGCVGSSFWPRDGGCHLTNTYKLIEDGIAKYYVNSHDCQRYGCHVETWGGYIDDYTWQASINPHGEHGKTYQVNSYLNNIGTYDPVSSIRVVGDGCKITFKDSAGHTRCELGPGVYNRDSFKPCGHDVITQYTVQYDPCERDNGRCSDKATCTNNNGAPVCACISGYEGNGYNCKEIDACKKANGGCSNNASCTSKNGRAKCKCNSGFEGEGKTCNRINPCNTNNGGCSSDATCTNKDGVADCDCNTGFEGDGKTCTRINPCNTNNGGCSSDATCTNQEGVADCDCNTGFEGDGNTCTRINPCNTNNGECSDNATCTNKEGVADCNCNVGFEGNGKSCTRINPCKTKNGGCSIDATCTNKDGIADCQCNKGFKGDGQFCKRIKDSTFADWNPSERRRLWTEEPNSDFYWKLVGAAAVTMGISFIFECIYGCTLEASKTQKEDPLDQIV